MNIFISYRRDDSADVAGRLRDRIAQEFGEESVYFDVDSIPIGVDFRHHIDQTLEECDAVLVLVGQSWAGAGEEPGARRIDDPTDPVRIEVERSLGKGLSVIPVLVQGGRMPSVADLPTELQDFAYRNGIPIRRDPDFHTDVNRLISGLRASTGTDSPVASSTDPADAAVESDDARRLGLSGEDEEKSGGGPDRPASIPAPRGLTVSLAIAAFVVVALAVVVAVRLSSSVDAASEGPMSSPPPTSTSPEGGHDASVSSGPTTTETLTTTGTLTTVSSAPVETFGAIDRTGTATESELHALGIAQRYVDALVAHDQAAIDSLSSDEFGWVEALGRFTKITAVLTRTTTRAGSNGPLVGLNLGLIGDQPAVAGSPGGTWVACVGWEVDSSVPKIYNLVTNPAIPVTTGALAEHSIVAMGSSWSC